MAWLRELLVRMGWSGGLDPLEREVDEEIRFHLEMRARSEREAGLDEDEAWREAERRFGDSDGIRREGARILAGAPSGRGGPLVLDGLRQDVALGARRLLRNPGATMLTAGVLALGLAAGTSVITYVNAFYQPFPGVDADGLMQVHVRSPDDPYTWLSYPDFLDLEAAEGDVIAEVAGSRTGWAASVRHETFTEVVYGEAVTGDYFGLLDAEMSLGRGIGPDDDLPGSDPVVVLSRAWWARAWNSDPAAVGSTVYLNNNPYTIVGVAGPGFLGSDAGLRPDVWMPLEQYKIVYWARSPVATMLGVPVIKAFVRLGDGVSGARGGEALSALAAGLDDTAPLELGTRDFHLAPATWIHPGVRLAEAPRNRLLMVAGAVLLLLACANVANLLLAASTGRRREMALRAAHGASPGRLFRQLLTENVLFALLAGALALAVTGPASARIGSYFDRPSVWGSFVPRSVSMDQRVFWLGLALAVLAGVIAGLLPALRGSRRDLVEVLKEGGEAHPGPGRGRFRLPGVRDVLVAVQVGLAVVLLVVSGLVLRTLDTARGIDVGFDTEHTVASFLTTSSTDIPVEGRRLFYQELAQHFESLPWVRAATVSAWAPLSSHPTTELRADAAAEGIQTTMVQAVPNYFETLGMTVTKGRGFAQADTMGTPTVMVVNERLAERFFPGEDPVGRTVWWGSGQGGEVSTAEIVGVVANAKVTDVLADFESVAYLAYPQHYYTPGNALVLDTNIEPRAAVPLLEQELRKVNSRLALLNALPYKDVVEGFTYAQRMNAELFSVAALLGLALATAGVFGVLSLAVGRRTREIGIRLAVGASAPDIARAVLARIAPALVVGVGAGLAAAVATGPLVESLLIDVTPDDPLALGGGVLVLLLASLGAVWLPVRRALRVDPMTSLRVE